LYDIAADPGETKDLSGEHPEQVEQMKKHYDKWFTEVTTRWSTQAP
jgi:hypothetical protein